MIALWQNSFAQQGLFFQFAGATALSPLIACTRGTTGTIFDSTGALSTIAINDPRFDYNPSTLAALGVLEEQASTNSLLSSEDLRTSGEGNPTAAWATFQTTITADAIASPDGTADADKIICDNSGSSTYTRTQTKAGLTNDAAYSLSVFLKAGEVASGVSLQFRDKNNVIKYSKDLNLSTGALTGADSGGTARVETCQNGWYRLFFENVSAASGATIPDFRIVFTGTGTGSNGFYAFGAKLELGAVATSYIKTTTAAVTRNLDRFTIGTLTPWFNAAGGTIVARVAMGLPVSGSNHSILRFSDNSYDNSIRLAVSSTGYPQIGVFSGGIDIGVATDTTVMVADTFTTIAVSYQSSKLEISQNGAAIVEDTSITLPSGMTRLDLLGDHAGGNAPTRAWLKWLRYYPSAYIGASLQQLSSLT